jgi:hypothetical protein
MLQHWGCYVKKNGGGNQVTALLVTLWDVAGLAMPQQPTT